jgi:hypothetical protein
MPIPSLPYAASWPPWSGPHPSQIGETYGTLYATPAPGGAWMLCHDKAGEFHALTLNHPPGETVDYLHRRWHVVRL